MYTLQEFMAYTKGWEYIIASMFVFSFIAFWRLLDVRPPTEPKRRVQESPAPKSIEEREIR